MSRYTYQHDNGLALNNSDSELIILMLTYPLNYALDWGWLGWPTRGFELPVLDPKAAELSAGPAEIIATSR